MRNYIIVITKIRAAERSGERGIEGKTESIIPRFA